MSSLVEHEPAWQITLYIAAPFCLTYLWGANQNVQVSLIQGLASLPSCETSISESAISLQWRCLGPTITTFHFRQPNLGAYDWGEKPRLHHSVKKLNWTQQILSQSHCKGILHCRKGFRVNGTSVREQVFWVILPSVLDVQSKLQVAVPLASVRGEHYTASHTSLRNHWNHSVVARYLNKDVQKRTRSVKKKPLGASRALSAWLELEQHRSTVGLQQKCHISHESHLISRNRWSHQS